MSFKKVPKVKRNKQGKYNLRPQDMYNSARRYDTPLYLIGTIYLDEKGDEVTEDGGFLFQAVGGIELNYVGSRLEGFGRVFPMRNSRELTREEVIKYNREGMVMCGVRIPLNIPQPVI